MAAHKGNGYAKIWTDDKLKVLIDDLLDYAENSRSAHFAPWARKHGKTKSWINRLVEDYPVFAAAYADAKDLMAGKLVNSSIYQDDPNFNGTHAMSYQALYNKEWRDFLKFKAEIGKDAEAKASFEDLLEAFRSGALIKKLSQDELDGDNNNG